MASIWLVNNPDQTGDTARYNLTGWRSPSYLANSTQAALWASWVGSRWPGFASLGFFPSGFSVGSWAAGSSGVLPVGYQEGSLTGPGEIWKLQSGYYVSIAQALSVWLGSSVCGSAPPTPTPQPTPTPKGTLKVTYQTTKGETTALLSWLDPKGNQQALSKLVLNWKTNKATGTKKVTLKVGNPTANQGPVVVTSEDLSDYFYSGLWGVGSFEISVNLDTKEPTTTTYQTEVSEFAGSLNYQQVGYFAEYDKEGDRKQLTVLAVTDSLGELVNLGLEGYSQGTAYQFTLTEETDRPTTEERYFKGKTTDNQLAYLKTTTENPTAFSVGSVVYVTKDGFVYVDKTTPTESTANLIQGKYLSWLASYNDTNEQPEFNYKLTEDGVGELASGCLGILPSWLGWDKDNYYLRLAYYDEKKTYNTDVSNSYLVDGKPLMAPTYSLCFNNFLGDTYTENNNNQWYYIGVGTNLYQTHTTYKTTTQGETISLTGANIVAVSGLGGSLRPMAATISLGDSIKVSDLEFTWVKYSDGLIRWHSSGTPTSDVIITKGTELVSSDDTYISYESYKNQQFYSTMDRLIATTTAEYTKNQPNPLVNPTSVKLVVRRDIYVYTTYAYYYVNPSDYLVVVECNKYLTEGNQLTDLTETEELTVTGGQGYTNINTNTKGTAYLSLLTPYNSYSQVVPLGIQVTYWDNSVSFLSQLTTPTENTFMLSPKFSLVDTNVIANTAGDVRAVGYPLFSQLTTGVVKLRNGLFFTGYLNLVEDQSFNLHAIQLVKVKISKGVTLVSFHQVTLDASSGTTTDVEWAYLNDKSTTDPHLPGSWEFKDLSSDDQVYGYLLSYDSQTKTFSAVIYQDPIKNS